MMTDRRRAGAVALLVVAAVAGAGAGLFTFGFLSEYGSTGGSRAEGAVDGVEFAVVPLLVVVGLAAGAVVLGRRSAWLRGVAVAVVALSVGGVLVAGSQAAVARFDGLPRLPHCYDADFAGSPAEAVARAVQDAFSGLEHPWRFSGGGSTGLDGCGTTLLDVTFGAAAAHYRGALPAAGWEVVRDDGAELRARRGDLLFVLTRSGCGSVGIAIMPAAATGFPQVC